MRFIVLAIVFACAFVVIALYRVGMGGAGGVPAVLYRQEIRIDNKTDQRVWISFFGDVLTFRNPSDAPPWIDVEQRIGPRGRRYQAIEANETKLIHGVISDAYGLDVNDETTCKFYLGGHRASTSQYQDRIIEHSSMATEICGPGKWRLIMQIQDGQLVIEKNAESE